MEIPPPGSLLPNIARRPVDRRHACKTMKRNTRDGAAGHWHRAFQPLPANVSRPNDSGTNFASGTIPSPDHWADQGRRTGSVRLVLPVDQAFAVPDSAGVGKTRWGAADDCPQSTPSTSLPPTGMRSGQSEEPSCQPPPIRSTRLSIADISSLAFATHQLEQDLRVPVHRIWKYVRPAESITEKEVEPAGGVVPPNAVTYEPNSESTPLDRFPVPLEIPASPKVPVSLETSFRSWAIVACICSSILKLAGEVSKSTFEVRPVLPSHFQAPHCPRARCPPPD